jgi:hypothetical protein
MIQQWHNKTKMYKSNGYTFLLGKRQSQTRSVPRLLGPMKPTCSRLFHKTPFAGVSQKNAQNIYTCKRATDESEMSSRFRIARVC